jgi:REP element-mobilizing transposase RayT
MLENLNITRRHLPHITLKGATYFVTFRITNDNLLSIEEQKIVLEHIKKGSGKFYSLIACIVLPNHVHIVLTPKQEFSISEIMKGIKGVSARKINLIRNSKGSIWLSESYDKIVRSEDELNKYLVYMLYNPVKMGLSDDPFGYHGWYLNNND